MYFPVILKILTEKKLQELFNTTFLQKQVRALFRNSAKQHTQPEHDQFWRSFHLIYDLWLSFYSSSLSDSTDTCTSHSVKTQQGTLNWIKLIKLRFYFSISKLIQSFFKLV